MRISNHRGLRDPLKDSGKSNQQQLDEMRVLDPNVHRPLHYQGKRFDVIDVIEDYGLGFNTGNAVKYILRAGKKDSYVQDLKKAIWYLERECANIAAETASLEQT